MYGLPLGPLPWDPSGPKPNLASAWALVIELLSLISLALASSFFLSAASLALVSAFLLSAVFLIFFFSSFSFFFLASSALSFSIYALIVLMALVLIISIESSNYGNDILIWVNKNKGTE